MGPPALNQRILVRLLSSVAPVLAFSPSLLLSFISFFSSIPVAAWVRCISFVSHWLWLMATSALRWFWFPVSSLLSLLSVDCIATCMAACKILFDGWVDIVVVLPLLILPFLLFPPWLSFASISLVAFLWLPLVFVRVVSAWWFCCVFCHFAFSFSSRHDCCA